MSTSAAFDYVSDQVEQLTDFNRIEARGTVRLALKAAGLDGATVTAGQMGVVVSRTLPAELAARSVADPAGLCARIQRGLERIDSAPTPSSTDDVFRRLGG